ncbi:hypothetical protein [Streptomyces sp. NPDC029526]|uniref:hypothetical protein n=1 Tax=Streptomyces sp. NPDC029526 TaxID=3155728 RepID=UPI0034090F22
MHPDTHLMLHGMRAAELRAEADTRRPAGVSGPSLPAVWRARVGWTLVEVGLRLAMARGTAVGTRAGAGTGAAGVGGGAGVGAAAAVS